MRTVPLSKQIDYHEELNTTDNTTSITGTITYYVYEGGKRIVVGVYTIFAWGYSKLPSFRRSEDGFTNDRSYS